MQLGRATSSDRREDGVGSGCCHMQRLAERGHAEGYELQPARANGMLPAPAGRRHRLVRPADPHRAAGGLGTLVGQDDIDERNQLLKTTWPSHPAEPGGHEDHGEARVLRADAAITSARRWDEQILPRAANPWAAAFARLAVETNAQTFPPPEAASQNVLAPNERRYNPGLLPARDQSTPARPTQMKRAPIRGYNFNGLFQNILF